MINRCWNLDYVCVLNLVYSKLCVFVLILKTVCVQAFECQIFFHTEKIVPSTPARGGGFRI